MGYESVALSSVVRGGAPTGILDLLCNRMMVLECWLFSGLLVPNYLKVFCRRIHFRGLFFFLNEIPKQNRW